MKDWTPENPKWADYIGLILGVVLIALLLYVLWPVRHTRQALVFALLLFVAAGAAVGYRFAKYRERRRRTRRQPFPPAWRQLLEDRVSWYRRLDADARARFERSVQLFLEEKRITGVETDVDDEVRLLVAASAMIPVFGYPDWLYPGLEEVILYPNAFSDNYELEGPGAELLGLMGDEELSRVVLLSKPDLLEGFRRAAQGPSPGIHEFVHRFDAADGALDGVPELGETDPDGWLDLVDREIERVHQGRSRLDPYAGTDEVEFLAVASETFFLHPEWLFVDHPELYHRLARIFRQNPVQRQPPAIARRRPSPYAFRPKRPRRE
jgi:Mlc titration factor MtfA (ptsG expression regulator)